MIFLNYDKILPLKEVRELTILAFDSATKIFSVALAENNETKNILASYQYAAGKQHGEIAVPIIQQMMEQLLLTPQDISKLMVGIGPGSYTGLRIGVTIAKTWAQSLTIPLVTISSLSLMLPDSQIMPNTLYVPMMDARRQTVYAAGYIAQDGCYHQVFQDQHIAWDDLKEQLLTYIEAQPNIERISLVGDKVANDYQADLKDRTKRDILVTTNFSGQPHVARAILAPWQKLLNDVPEIATLSPNYAHLTLAEQEWRIKQEEGQDCGISETYIDITH